MNNDKFIAVNKNGNFHTSYPSSKDYSCDATKAMDKEKEKLRRLLAGEIERREEN